MVAQSSMYNKLWRFTLIIWLIGIYITPFSIKADSVSPMIPISLSQWQTKLKDHTGNIVVVDMWAMWCTNCIERFPEMVKLHNKYKDENVIFVSMNLDDREDSSSIIDANHFLATMNATFTHYHMDENLMLTFNELDLLGIPAVLIYDQFGNEKFRLTGDNPNKQFTEYDVENAIITLLYK